MKGIQGSQGKCRPLADKNMKSLSIRVNERKKKVPQGKKLSELINDVKPGADIAIINGYPASVDCILQDGDSIVLIIRGEVPPEHELENLMMARHTPGVHRRLKKAIVGIAGLGGLGSCVATALARVGIGTLVIADYDVVEPSNLNRQHYLIRHIGMKKTEALQEILGQINPYINIDAYDIFLDDSNLPRVFAKAQILIECLDRAEAKSMLIASAAQNLPRATVIGASGLAGFGASNLIQTTRINDKLFIVGDLVAGAAPGRGLMAPRVGIAAHHQANLAMAILLGEMGQVL